MCRQRSLNLEKGKEREEMDRKRMWREILTTRKWKRKEKMENI